MFTVEGTSSQMEREREKKKIVGGKLKNKRESFERGFTCGRKR